MTLAIGLSLLALFNGARAEQREAPLKLDHVLMNAAQIKAHEIQRCGFKHDACGRPWFVDLPNRAWLGENIASGYTSARSVFNGYRVAAAPGEHHASAVQARRLRQGRRVLRRRALFVIHTAAVDAGERRAGVEDSD